MQQFLRRTTILKTFRGRRGFSAGRCRSHRVYNTVISTTLYQRFLRLRRLLHGTSSPQLPPALTDALVPQVQVCKKTNNKFKMRRSASALILTRPKMPGVPKKNKEKRGRKTHRSASRPSGLNDRKHLSLPCEVARHLSIYAQITSPGLTKRRVTTWKSVTVTIGYRLYILSRAKQRQSCDDSCIDTKYVVTINVPK